MTTSALPIGRVISRSSVPDVRSRSMATLVTRNITSSGKKPDEQRTELVEHRVPSNIQAISPSSTHGSRTTRAMVRWSWRSWVSTRRVVAR